MPNCDRCYQAAQISIMSRFNTDTICMACEEKEKAHPRYKEAQAAELRAVQAGNYNYPGIGKPSDL
jgi:hypothetical protein